MLVALSPSLQKALLDSPCKPILGKICRITVRRTPLQLFLDLGDKLGLAQVPDKAKAALPMSDWVRAKAWHSVGPATPLAHAECRASLA